MRPDPLPLGEAQNPTQGCPFTRRKRGVISRGLVGPFTHTDDGPMLTPLSLDSARFGDSTCNPKVWAGEGVLDRGGVEEEPEFNPRNPPLPRTGGGGWEVKRGPRRRSHLAGSVRREGAVSSFQ